MIFTDNPVLMELGKQINGLLIAHQKVKADFKKGVSLFPCTKIGVSGITNSTLNSFCSKISLYV